MANSKSGKPVKRRKALLRLRVRAQSREPRAERGRDLGDVRLQLLLDAATPVRDA
jgi:hypothetical protein